MLVKKISIPFITVFLFGVILIMSSCASINRFTRVKKIPREYSFNYCGGQEIKAPKTDLNKEPWIVYSDRSENQTYNTPGGKVKAKDIGYLDPFLVIGSKGEYLKLIKYTPDILKNGKLDYKKAEYYGWISKSKLLLNNQTRTDIKSGHKIKTLVILTDSISINQPDQFFVTDSIKVYKDLDFKSTSGSLSPYSIVYRLKESDDKSMSLISKKTMIQPETIEDDVLGWIDNSLIKDIGTGLHVNLKTVPNEKGKFVLTNNKKIITLTDDLSYASNMLADSYKTLRFNPITAYSTKDSLIAFKTQIALPIFDYRNNYIFNVAGEQISNKKFKEISQNLKKINISFVFEGGEQIIKQFPQIVNALQNLQPLFEQTDDRFSYQFNTVSSFDETGKLIRPAVSNFTSDYSEILNTLTEKANQKDKLHPIKVPLNSWPALRKSIETFGKEKNETNLIILIGDKRQTSSSFDAAFYDKILKNNCRIIGFQIYGGEGDDYNNFVLDIEDLINNYAGDLLKSKNNILVSPEQVKRVNNFIQVDENQNSYRLDFPNNSITQGGVFFPPKNELLPMEVITNNIDTIIQQIKQDNSSVTEYMSKAFHSVGNNRTKFDSLFVQNYGIDSARVPQKKLIASFVDKIPAWYMPSEIVVLNDSINKSVDYRLMTSKSEMEELKDFITSLSVEEVDFISQAQKKQKPKKTCNCPEDDLFAEIEKEEQAATLENDSTIRLKEFYTKRIVSVNEYANTKKVRNYLTKTLLKPIKNNKSCRDKKIKPESLTLAEIQYRITGSPTSSEILNSIKIKNLKNKKIVSDEKLDQLVDYYKKMKPELEKAEQFESNGEVFYWVNRKLLP